MATTTNLHYIEQLASTWEPRMRDAFLRAVQETADQINIAALTRMLESGNISGALWKTGKTAMDRARCSI